jgi:hypothetical protein
LFPDTEFLTKLYDLIAKGQWDIIVTQVQSGTQEIQMMPWFSKTALELIGQGGLGYSFDTFNDSSENQHAQAIKKLL